MKGYNSIWSDVKFATAYVPLNYFLFQIRRKGFCTLLLSLHVALYDPATSQQPTDPPFWNSPCTLTQPATARGQMEAPGQLLPLNYILRTMTDAARLARHRARNTLRVLVSRRSKQECHGLLWGSHENKFITHSIETATCSILFCLSDSH